MLFDQIAEIVAEHLDCDKEEIKAESTFESLGSTHWMQLNWL